MSPTRPESLVIMSTRRFSFWSGSEGRGGAEVVVAETVAIAGCWSGTSTMDEVEARGMGAATVAETFLHAVWPVRRMRQTVAK